MPAADTDVARHAVRADMAANCFQHRMDINKDFVFIRFVNSNSHAKFSLY